jgi:multicomponent Na+:H+ antiporter subunit G
MTVVVDAIAGVLLLAGGVLALAAGVGLVRFPDLLARMHTAAKPQVLGLLLMLAALALRLRDWRVVGMLLLVAMLQLVTAPVAAHMVARAGYRTGKVDSERLVVDELTRDLAVAAGIDLLEGDYLDDYGATDGDGSDVGGPGVSGSGVSGPDRERPDDATH